jgi:DtxR family Mn-dependent transcriptional regulator
MANLLTCPMCGFEFDRDDTVCGHGCPLGPVCNLLRCPSCEYEFPETPARITRLGKLFGRKPARSPRLPEDVRPITQLRSGSTAEVLCLGDTKAPRQHRLAVFGVIPGAEVTLVQRQPSTVLRIGETELALDTEIADEILVRPIEGDAEAA